MIKVDEDRMVGQMVLGRYRIVRKLAKGGMGVIYLARSEGAAGFVKPVVVKRILTDLMGEASMINMFAREARIMSNLQHPNIVSVLDFSEEEGAYIMVLEYINGVHLGRWLRFMRQSGQPFPQEFAIHIVAQVLDALHYAHTLPGTDGKALNIIHRDVTPSNVLLDVDGRVKLADFGIARMRTDATDVRSEGNTIKGKFAYLAPELFRGAAPNPATDAYSCAVVMYELLSGSNPFRTSDMPSTIARVLHDVPAPLHKVRPDISEGLSNVLVKALEKQASWRFQSAQDLAVALRDERALSADNAATTIAKEAARDFQDPRMSPSPSDSLNALERAWREMPSTASKTQTHADTRGAIDIGGITTIKLAAPPPMTGTAQGTRLTPPIANSASTAVVDVASLISPTNSSPPTVVAAPQVQLAPPAKSISAGSGAMAATTQPTLPTVQAPHSRMAQTVVSGRSSGTSKLGRVLVSTVVVASCALAGLFYVKSRADRPDSDPQATQPDSPPHTQTAQTGYENPELAKQTAQDELKRLAESAALKEKEGPRQLSYKELVEEHRVDLDGCKTKHHPLLTSGVSPVIRFELNQQGDVIHSELVPKTLGGSAYGKCVIEVAKGIGFGPQTGPVSFRVPL